MKSKSIFGLLLTMLALLLGVAACSTVEHPQPVPEKVTLELAPVELAPEHNP